MTAILYIILGLSIGIGLTLLYLQERFIRERRLLVAMGESERAKSAKMLKDLDEQWEASCSQYKEDIETYKKQIEDLNNEISAVKVATPAEQLQSYAIDQNQEPQPDIAKYELEAKNKDAKLKELTKGNEDLRKSLASYQQEIKELQAELAFFKGEVARLEEEAKKLPADNDFIVLADGGHLLPGSVARAFMGKQS